MTKKNNLMIFILLILLFAFTTACSTAKQESLLPTKACFRTESGEKCVDLELAQTTEEKSQGLMFREIINENYGMLFINNESGKRCMWMKNMNFPIDIMWLDKDNIIIYIQKQARPCNKDLCDILCFEKSKDVLELKSGFADKYGIEIGDYVDIK